MTQFERYILLLYVCFSLPTMQAQDTAEVFLTSSTQQYTYDSKVALSASAERNDAYFQANMSPFENAQNLPSYLYENVSEYNATPVYDMIDIAAKLGFVENAMQQLSKVTFIDNSSLENALQNPQEASTLFVYSIAMILISLIISMIGYRIRKNTLKLF